MPQALYPPSPKTTVFMVITATRFPLAVYLFFMLGFKQNQQPGEYYDKSFVFVTESFLV
jgi:hypothetical protein